MQKTQDRCFAFVGGGSSASRDFARPPWYDAVHQEMAKQNEETITNRARVIECILMNPKEEKEPLGEIQALDDHSAKVARSASLVCNYALLDKIDGGNSVGPLRKLLKKERIGTHSYMFGSPFTSRKKKRILKAIVASWR